MESIIREGADLLQAERRFNKEKFEETYNSLVVRYETVLYETAWYAVQIRDIEERIENSEVATNPSKHILTYIPVISNYLNIPQSANAQPNYSLQFRLIVLTYFFDYGRDGEPANFRNLKICIDRITKNKESRMADYIVTKNPLTNDLKDILNIVHPYKGQPLDQSIYISLLNSDDSYIDESKLFDKSQLASMVNQFKRIVKLIGGIDNEQAELISEKFAVQIDPLLNLESNLLKISPAQLMDCIQEVLN